MWERLPDEEIYTKYADDLIRFAMGLVGRSDAQDVVSAAVLRSISWDSWSQVTNHRSYLYRAVLNQARNEYRERQRRWNKELRAADHLPVRALDARVGEHAADGRIEPRRVRGPRG